MIFSFDESARAWSGGFASDRNEVRTPSVSEPRKARPLQSKGSTQKVYSKN